MLPGNILSQVEEVKDYNSFHIQKNKLSETIKPLAKENE
jgi:hypothetical protein